LMQPHCHKRNDRHLNLNHPTRRCMNFFQYISVFTVAR
jgi:hypothetical protein